MPTDLRFTGQRELGRDGVGMGSLMFYGSRAYSPVLGRFVSADTVVPGAGNPQALNRYTYAGNSPLNGTDPDGHCYPLCTVAAGALIGTVLGAGVQVISNYGLYRL